MKTDNNLPLILYGAGRNAKKAYDRVLKLGLNPVCFVDKDSEKWNKPAYDGCPLIVYSLEEARAKYGDIDIYVTTEEGNMLKYPILEYLVEKAGISQDKIINYEPYIRRKSCGLFEDTIAPLGERDVGLCRGGRLINVTKMPTVEWLDDPAETLDNFLEMRQELLDEIQEDQSASPCDGCAILREQAWPRNYRVKNYVLSTEPESVCQFKCIYCYSGHYGNNHIKTRKSKDKAIDKRVDLLLEMEKRGIAGPEFTVISLSDGEICVDPKRENLFKLAERYMTRIYSNGGIFSKEIASLMERGKTLICVSIDAGTQETFAKIKGVDAFGKVCENMREYAKINPQLIWLQYLYLPGRNDAAEDIDGFVSLCNEIRPEAVMLLLDVLTGRDELEESILEGYFSLLDKLLINGHKLQISANLVFSESERNRLWEMAKNNNDGIVRDESYFVRLKSALTEKIY